MESCRHVLLDLVIVAVLAALDKAGEAVRSQYEPAELVAYCLNRLPCYFVATEADWEHQHSQAPAIYGQDIERMARQAMLSVKNNPLRPDTPLPPEELASPMRSLYDVQRLLEKEDLTWQDLPSYIQYRRQDAAIRAKYSGPADPNKAFLRRKALKKELAENTFTAAALSPEAHTRFALYLQLGTLPIVHALQVLVLRAASRRLRQLPLEERRYVSLDTVAARALSGLPPMYASTRDGLNYLRFQAKTELGSEFAALVDRAITDTIQAGPPASPLLFADIRRAREQAIATLATQLAQPQLTWQNLPEKLHIALFESPPNPVG